MQNRFKPADTTTCCPTGLWGKPREIGLLRGRAHSVSVSCCPIEIGEFKESEPIPDHTSHECEQAGEAMRPLALESDESQQNIQQQSRPQLPADGVPGVSKEVAELEGLFDLFEEGLDTPPAAIQVANTGGGPLKVVGEKDHDHPLVVDLDPGFNTSKSLGVFSARFGRDESDLVVAKDITLGFSQSFAADVVAKIVLGPGDPENAPVGEVEKVGKIHVGLVEDRDFPGFKSGAQGQGAGIVMKRGFLDNGEGRKETLQVQSEVQLGGGLASAMLGPVHAVGHQGDGRRVDRVDGAFEAMRQFAVATGRAKPWSKLLQVTEHLPEKLLHHVAVPVFVGVGERVAARGHRPADCSQLRRMMTQGVANVIEPDGMGQLSKKKADHVAPGRKSPGLLVYSVLAGKFFRQMRRNQFTELMQCAAVVFGRRYGFHTSDSLVGIRRRPPYFSRLMQSLQLHPVG